ncbi:MAG TPA: flagellar assembly protein FliW [Firmicutes bacterium]|nr:flagellar assembly protein FliW [Candidatus Fermentithermobacillaceae bacterium]
MLVQTKRFGQVEIDSSRVITFPNGLIGFPEFKEYVVLDFAGGNSVLRWLQSVQEPSLGFVTLSLYDVFPDYDPEFCPSDLADLGGASPDDLVLLSVVTVPPDIRKMTANLQAPLVLNPATRLGKQVIVMSPEYTTRHYVFSTLESLMKRTG